MTETRIDQLWWYHLSFWADQPTGGEKGSKDRLPEAHISRKSGSCTKAPTGTSFAKDSKVSNSGKTMDIKDVECSSVTRKDTMRPKVRMKRRRMGYFKVRQLEGPSIYKKNDKSIRQIRIRHSDLNSGDYDPFLWYGIKIHDLSGPVRDPTHPGYLVQVFVDTGANWLILLVSRTLFEQLIDRGLVLEFIKGPGVRINLVGGQNLMISGDKGKWKLVLPQTWESRPAFKSF